MGWNFFCEWTFERCQNNLGFKKLLAVDELQMFSSTSQLSWEQCLVVETGRKYELDFLAISQQMNLVHNRLRNQLTEMVVFNQQDKLILEALEDKGFNPSEIMGLGKGFFICRNFQNGSEYRGSLDLTNPNVSLESNQEVGTETAVTESNPPSEPESSDS